MFLGCYYCGVMFCDSVVHIEMSTFVRVVQIFLQFSDVYWFYLYLLAQVNGTLHPRPCVCVREKEGE